VRQPTIKRVKLIGYLVLEASDGPTALEILKRGDAVDLVFTDLIMPGGLSGREIARRARALRPDVKVLLASGYAERARARRAPAARAIESLTRLSSRPT